MFKVDDSLDAFWIHGLVGIWGSVATAIFIADYAMPEDYNMGSQLVAQFSAIGLTIVYSGIVTAIVYFIASAITGGGRVDEETESRGLDETVHGEKAINL
jgi:Amt family ammonium transporter